MPHIVIIIAGAAALGYVFDKGAEAADATAGATKWAVIGGALYVSYKVAKNRGVIK